MRHIAPARTRPSRGGLSTVTGPLTLDHGEPGIVVRVPVFQRGRDGREYFWGFIAVSMRLSEALARARVDELWKQGYNYAFFAPASAQQKAVTIAARGELSFQDAVQQPVRAQNLEFRLALWPRGGWVNATKVALESVGVLVVSGLLCLVLNLLESRRLANETAEPRQTSKDRSGAKDSAAGAQAEFTLAELQERLKGTVRRAREINELAQTKLKQAELNARELQTRLDATVRAAEEAARAKQAELEQARLALAQAQQAISELQGRLEAGATAESKTVAAAKARLQQDQATIADLTARMDAAKRSAKEAAEANAARLHQAEKRNRELTRRLLAAETRVTELSVLLQKSQGDLKRLEDDSARSDGVRTVAPIGRVPSEPKEVRSGEAVMSPVELSTASSPAIAVRAEPVEQTSATVLGEKLSPVCSLQPWVCSQVKVLPRQWMVGPSSNSRLRSGETLAGASSAVNGRACRWHQAAGGDWSAALANVQAATFRTDCRPESASFSETSEKGVLEQPSRDRNGEGSDDREMSHQMNLVSQRGRGRSMDAKYAQAKKGR